MLYPPAAGSRKKHAVSPSPAAFSRSASAAKARSWPGLKMEALGLFR